MRWKHAIVLLRVCLGLLSMLSHAQTPVPFVNQPLVPDNVAPGGPSFCLTVNGAGFVPDSVVKWNSHNLVTRFISVNELRATVPAAAIATATTAWVTVVNPAPGGGPSNVAFFTVATNRKDRAAFALASSLPTGRNPSAIGVGDFNGDGQQDLAVTNLSDNTVSILLGDGKGHFTQVSSPATGGGPNSVAVGDFNGDNQLDLAVTNYSDNTVSILLGDGVGNFMLASSTPTGQGPCCIVVGDFNADGKSDVALINHDDNSVWTLLGDGAGNFTMTTSSGTDYGPAAMGLGDFNGDGKLDLVVANAGYSSVWILLGDGAGNFTTGWTRGCDWCSWFGHPYSVAVGDLNGDKNLDLMIVNSCSHYQFDCYPDTYFVFLFGSGTGDFGHAWGPRTDGGPAIIGDFNGDNKLDLIVGTGAVFLGDGTGSFNIASYAGTGSAVAVGDFNRDGLLDLAFIDAGSNAVSIMLQASPASVRLSPVSLNFGEQSIGKTSPSKTVILSNPGTVPLSISRIETREPFSTTNNCPSSLASGESCTIVVSFNPHIPDSFTGTVIFAGNISPPKSVSLTGVGINPIASSPPSLHFGSRPVGTASPPKVITLTSLVGYEIVVLPVLDGDTRGWSANSTCAEDAPLYISCTVSVIFTPQFPGTAKATLTIFSYDYEYDYYGCPGCYATAQQVPLTGIGTAVSLSPANLNFGDQTVGTTSSPQTVTLTNYTTGTLQIYGLHFSGADGGSFSQNNTCGTSVPVGGSCTITVTFHPSSICAKTGTLTVSDNFSNSPQTMTLVGVGTVATLSPTSLDFGEQAVGTTSPAQTITFTNHSNRALTVFSVRLTGTNLGAFTQANNCGTSVAAGASCTFNVTFATQHAGVKTATLNVWDDGGGTPHQVTLTGRGN